MRIPASKYPVERLTLPNGLRVVLTPDEQLAGERIDADAEPLELTIA